MAATTYELIGQIINPRPVQRAAAAPRVRVLPSESVYELIGRIIGPPGAASAASRRIAVGSEEQIAGAVPAAV